MKSPFTWFMSRLGYVPAPAKLAASISTIKIDVEIDRASMDSALAKIKQLTKAALRARTIAKSISPPVPLQFATAELAADPARDELLNQMRELAEEIRSDRRSRVRS